MPVDPLSSPASYQEFIYSLPKYYPSILRSTLVYIPSGTLFGRVEGLILFSKDIILCVLEFLNFELGIIVHYGYEVSRIQGVSTARDLPDAREYCKATYPHKEKLYWYDSFPHPNDPTLVSTHPHHKHVPPDIKNHRIPAPNMSFTRPNLPVLIEEIEREILGIRR